MVGAKVCVVGAGVVGLTTAVKTQQQVPGVEVRRPANISVCTISSSGYSYIGEV